MNEKGAPWRPLILVRVGRAAEARGYSSGPMRSVAASLFSPRSLAVTAKQCWRAAIPARRVSLEARRGKDDQGGGEARARLRLAQGPPRRLREPELVDFLAPLRFERKRRRR